jgi:ParB family chromosome partitioning protein
MPEDGTQTIEMIPIEQVTCINPRVRNKKVFREIVDNIADVGLKRPITVARRQTPEGPRFDLVCGQGRLEACRDLGQRTIPALVIDADNEDCLVMSLVENLARRQHRAIELLRDIEGLKQRGYSPEEVAQKTGLSFEYVRGVIRLLENGEHRLLNAVESGNIPVSVAVEIAESDDEGVQRALQQAYEDKLLRGRKLAAARRLVEQRRRRGKGFRSGGRREAGAVSSTELLRTYREDVERKRLLIRKADICRDHLVFVTQALRSLFADENFVTLLRAEGLDTLPRNLGDRIDAGR